jgi:hypothetical protein
MSLIDEVSFHEGREYCDLKREEGSLPDMAVFGLAYEVLKEEVEIELVELEALTSDS